MPKHFIRKKEDFTCAVCGTFVKGTDYTNHCPNCLWSKHVDDKIPGDRSSLCQGLMEPILIETIRGQHSVVHQCKCDKIIKNKIVREDNFEKVLEISKKFSGIPIDKFLKKE